MYKLRIKNSTYSRIHTLPQERSRSLVPEPVFISKMAPKGSCGLGGSVAPCVATQGYLHPWPAVVGRREHWGTLAGPSVIHSAPGFSGHKDSCGGAVGPP